MTLTDPSAMFSTHPLNLSDLAVLLAAALNPTPCTLPEILISY